MKLRTAILAALLLGSCLPATAAAGTFADHFESGIDPIYWSNVSSPTSSYSITGSGGAVNMARISGKSNSSPDHLEYAALMLNLGALGGNISGAFTASVDFSAVALNPNPGTTIDQVQFNSWFSGNAIPSRSSSSYLLDVFDNTVDQGGTNVHIWYGTPSITPSLNAKVNVPSTTTAGTFLLSRDSANLVTGSIQIGGVTKTSFSRTITTPLWALEMTLQNNVSSNYPIAVRFDNFSLAAGSVPAVPELETWALLLAGLGFLAWRVNRYA